MKKLFLSAILISMVIFSVNSQTWSGSTTTTGNAYRTGYVGIGNANPQYPLSVSHPSYSITTSATNYKIGGNYDMMGTYGIPSGITDGGYRLGLDINAHVSSASFLGTLSQQIGLRIQYGTYTGSGAGTITSAIGLYLQGLEGGSATITHKYGIYQTGANYINCFEGNLGLGIANPTAKLELIGDIRIKAAANDAGDFIFIKSDLSQLGRIWTNNDGTSGIYLSSGDNTPDLTIGSTGNVGIGTVNPTDKLTVNGTIRATRVDIVSSIVSDFVFEPDYKLRSLKEVETFVQTNKHLPEVPSAEEFKTNGYSIGQMDDVLLRKVEELTLYTIEQQKLIEEQRKLFDAQQKLIDELLKKFEQIENN